jgi:hypothetical protein
MNTSVCHLLSKISLFYGCVLKRGLMIGSFGAFNILQGSLVSNFSINGKLNVF